ncbi:hypothetical protein GGI21_004565 [Coemansia aciculifera]|nr:hypothetical protein GGI21_004565 [Coemansia aciculifera]
MVRKIMFAMHSSIDLTKFSKESVADAIANIGAFVGRLREMAPNLGEVGIWPNNSRGKHLKVPHLKPILELMRRLFGLVKRVTVITNACRPLVENIDVRPITSLTSIRYQVKIYDSTVSRIVFLARRSSHCLQHLEIWTCDAGLDFMTLIRNKNMQWVNYPRLQTLKISTPKRSTAALRNAVSGERVVPFPCLRHLGIHCAYPFGDDVLFRGNAKTLESLRIEPNAQLVRILKTHSVFLEPASHPNLRCVNIAYLTSKRTSVFSHNPAAYLDFVLSIGGPSVAVRTIPGLSKFSTELSPVLSVTNDHANIQVLSLPCMSFTLWEVLALIKMLPVMSDLHSLTLILGEGAPAVPVEKLPAYVQAHYCGEGFGSRFRCWRSRIGGTRRFGGNKLARCVLLLALACPNFDYAAVKRSARKRFMESMQQLIDSNEFKEHAPRLQRLLFLEEKRPIGA